MSGCAIPAGYTRDCTTQKQMNGLGGDVYLFNKQDANGDAITFTEAGNIVSVITLPVGMQGYKVDGKKLMHTYAVAVGKTESKNTYYTHTFNLQVIIADAVQSLFGEGLLESDEFFAVVADQNQNWLIIGQNNGLESVEGDLFEIGTDEAGSVGSILPFSSTENYLKKFVDNGSGFDATKVYLDGLLVPAS